MRRRLLASTALIGTGLIAGPSVADDGIKLSLGGYFYEVYMAVADDNGDGEPGDEHNSDNFFSDSEVWFDGRKTLDNGLTFGAHIELEGETSSDQIDEAWAFVSGGFGEIRGGSIDDALSYNCVLPPGGTASFSAFSPNQWAANTVISNPACIGVDETDGGDAQKILYFSPVFNGFQLSLSYTPDGGAQDQTNFGGPHLGMAPHTSDESRHNFAAYLNYSYEGDDWSVAWGGGVGLEGKVESAPGPDRKKQEFIQSGLNLTFGNFSVGGAFEYFNHAFDRTGGGDHRVGEVIAKDVWVAGGGVAYAFDAWTIGAQYSHLDADTGSTPGLSDFTQDRVVATALYNVGPGIDIEAELGYTWVDSDPEGATNADGVEIDNYDAFEFGIGTDLTF